jgi:hypothetical protein
MMRGWATVWDLTGRRAEWGRGKIELPESCAGVAEPLRVDGEVKREAHADSTTPPDLAAMWAMWAG